MKYLILSLVANLLVFGVLSAIGLNINILAAMMELEDIDVLITSKDFGFDEILFYTLYLLLILIVLYYLKKQVKHKI
ncbi:Protein msa [Staphylococcus aureus]|nr:Protein msa [Staphylococcus aureus]